MAKIKVGRVERVDNPYYKMFVKEPCIRTEHNFDSEDDANKFINDDIDKYLAEHRGNEIKANKIELPWQVGANLTDHSRFGGLCIYYLKTTVTE